MSAHITEDQKILRHSAAHLLAHAISELYPDTLLTIGPATDEGFFYDFLPSTNFKLEDLPLIEARMIALAEKNYPITHKEISKDEARKLYHNNPFKLELIDGIPGDTVGLSCQGEFYDLCRGGHEKSTGSLKHVKLTAISGSYWRADRSKQALQRISGVAFPTAHELAEYERLKEEALKYDHRKLGKQLDLFSFHDEGVGFPFFHAKGYVIIRILTDYLRGLLEKAGYQEISTPVMLTDDLWRQSGHYQHYKDNMYFCIIDEKQYAIKPMNCPGSILVYRERPHSYRELPLRLAEFGKVHRYELSGVLHGLFRVRAFTIDDAHVYCTPEQIESEVQAMVRMTFGVLKKFGFDTIDVAVSTKPDNAMGDDLLWDKATKALEHALDKEQIPYVIQPGEGAFYGPKIEFKIKDSMNRQWQCGTVQIDFFQPQNFDLSYIAASGKKERPVMIHRAIYGSLERFLGVLLEHYKGTLPFWVSPVQARILTITDAQNEYAQKVYAALKDAGIRVEVDTTSDKINAQIKTAQLDKIPWMIVVGQKETDTDTVTLRHRDGKQEFGLTINQLIQKAKELA